MEQSALSSANPGPAVTVRRPRSWSRPLLVLLMVLLAMLAAVTIHLYGFWVLLALPALAVLARGVARPDLILGIFTFVTFTQLSEIAIQVYGLPSLAQPLAGLLGVILMLRIVVYGERPTVWPRSASALLAYLLVLFVSLAAANDFTTAVTWLLGMAKDMIGGVLVFFLVQRPAALRSLMWPVILAGVVMGTISVIQYLSGDFTNNFGGFGGWQQQVAGEVTRNRLTGPYANPNAYAQVLVVIMAVALGRLWHEKHGGLRLLAGWSALVCMAAIVLTYSRGGFLTMAATLAVLLLQSRSRFLPLLITALVGVILLQFLPADYGGRLSTLFQIAPTENNQIYDASFRGRLSENIAAWRMFTDHPFLGVGPGHFRLNYQEYSRQIGLDPRRIERTPASLYMEILAEQGLLGALVFVVLVYLLFRGLARAKQIFNELGYQDHVDIVISLTAALAGYLIAATAKNSAYSNVFWLLVGLTISAELIAVQARRSPTAGATL